MLPLVDIRRVTDEPRAEEGALKEEFSIVRKGYDPAEVQKYLGECDVAFRELEEYVARLQHELSEANREVTRLQAAEEESVDRAMLAVFEAKERIMDKARLKAREIEDEARLSAGVTAPPDTPDGDASDADGVEFSVAVTSETGDESSALAEDAQIPDNGNPAAPDGPVADDILRQMVSEADVIKAQLEAGMSAALEEMERMQQEAEARASDLLDEARQEAIRLRSAGADSKLVGTTLEVTLGEEPGEDEKRSRYSRTSAKLPRLGTEDGPSVLASMNQLRSRLREADAEERGARQESTAS